MERFKYHKQKSKAARDPSKAVYATQRWKRLRVMILARDPVCRKCNNALSVDVDHIDGDNTNMRESNLQGLCKPCHTRKTHHV